MYVTTLNCALKTRLKLLKQYAESHHVQWYLGTACFQEAWESPVNCSVWKTWPVTGHWHWWVLSLHVEYQINEVYQDKIFTSDSLAKFQTVKPRGLTVYQGGMHFRTIAGSSVLHTRLLILLRGETWRLVPCSSVIPLGARLFLFLLLTALVCWHLPSSSSWKVPPVCPAPVLSMF